MYPGALSSISIVVPDIWVSLTALWMCSNQPINCSWSIQCMRTQLCSYVNCCRTSFKVPSRIPELLLVNGSLDRHIHKMWRLSSSSSLDSLNFWIWIFGIFFNPMIYHHWLPTKIVDSLAATATRSKDSDSILQLSYKCYRWRKMRILSKVQGWVGVVLNDH